MLQRDDEHGQLIMAQDNIGRLKHQIANLNSRLESEVGQAEERIRKLNAETIANTPSVTRDIKDILKLNPFVTLDDEEDGEESISIGGVPMFARRSASAPATKESASTDNASRFQDLSLSAKSEAAMKNNRLINTAIGTGACLNPIPYITLPLMGLGIIGNVGVPEPESKFYKDLDLRLKTQYNIIYFKEIKKLRSQQCYAPTLTAVAMLGIIIFTNL